MSRREPGTGGVDPAQFLSHVVRVVCTDRHRHPRAALVTLARPRGQFGDQDGPRIVVRGERDSRTGYAEHGRQGASSQVPEDEPGERPAPSPLILRCSRCPRSWQMLTGAGSSLVDLFDALDREPHDVPGTVLRFDTSGWSTARGDTFGPRLLDVSALD